MQIDFNYLNQFGDLENQIETLDIAVKKLQEGKLIAYPTDTLYGLGCDAFNVKAVELIFEVKQRPMGMPIPLIIGTRDQIHLVTEDVTDMINALMDAFWPGPLTLIVPAGPKVPAIVGSRGWKIPISNLR
jgi:L-threonylcarbamoyladenylate synthase